LNAPESHYLANGRHQGKASPAELQAEFALGTGIVRGIRDIVNDTHGLQTQQCRNQGASK
jgi:hypothetical protein